MRALLLKQIVRPDSAGNNPGRHYGKLTRLFWHWVYDCFAAYAVVQRPPGFHSKSVLLADVWKTPPGGGSTAYLSVSAMYGSPASFGAPVMVEFPHVPEILLGPEPAGSFAEGRDAYGSLLGDTVARVNLIVPAALALASAGQGD